MKFDMKTAMPRADVHSKLSNMKTLIIEADGKLYTGECDITNLNGTVTLTVIAEKKSKPRKKYSITR